MTPSEEFRLLTVKQAADRLCVHPSTVRNLARDGHLRVVRLPGVRSVRFDLADVIALTRDPA